MEKKIILSPNQLALLEKLSNEQLRALVEIKESQAFLVFKDIINLLIDQEKNMFFAEKEFKYPLEHLHVLHALARGGIGKLNELMYLIQGASVMLQKREAKQKEKKYG